MHPRPYQAPASQLAPSRKDTILIFAIIGWVACGIFSFVAYFMAKNDLEQIAMGQMADTDQSTLNTLKIVSMVHMLLMLLSIFCMCGIFALSLLGGGGYGGSSYGGY